MHTKTDPELGKQVEQHLQQLGINTPTTVELHIDDQLKIEAVTQSMTEIMNVVGLDLNDDSLVDTPKRVAKMLVLEKFWGLKAENFPKCTTIENKMKHNEMIVEKCTINSLCEHHFVYFGSLHNPKLGCWIAYIPNERVIGLSKLSRIAEYFSARPQVQERLVEQISETLKFILNTEHVAVLVKAQHFCVLTRGVSDPHAYTVTSKLSGAFMDDPATRKEFISYTLS